MHRRLVTVSGAAKNYGVVVRSSDYTVNEGATAELRQKMREERKMTGYSDDMSIDRGGTIRELMAKCEEETGLKKMRDGGMDLFDKA